MNITNNTILITGGASGIGSALTQKLVAFNNKIIIVGRDKTKLEIAESFHPNISFFQCDINSKEQLENLNIELQNKYPDLNILINNAAIQYNYYLTEESIPYTRIDSEINVNFTALVKLSAMLIPILNTKANSAIINVSSGLAFSPKESAPVYCATKAAVHSFTEALRYQLKPTNIKVFELIPPLTNTPMTSGRGDNKMSPEQVAEIFLKSFRNNIYEMNIGKTKLLRILLRLFPSFIKKKIRNSK